MCHDTKGLAEGTVLNKDDSFASRRSISAMIHLSRLRLFLRKRSASRSCILQSANFEDGGGARNGEVVVIEISRIRVTKLENLWASLVDFTHPHHVERGSFSNLTRKCCCRSR